LELVCKCAGFDFGLMQNGERVNDVKLPAWCHSDARLFVLIHRQALESDIVRQSLPAWIDLVFGYKQRGKEAVEAVNVFHPSVTTHCLKSMCSLCRQLCAFTAC